MCKICMTFVDESEREWERVDRDSQLVHITLILASDKRLM